ncbi:MAG: tetratricopeptide repeat protein [Candidatus Omnitrophota bacterium]
MKKYFMMTALMLFAFFAGSLAFSAEDALRDPKAIFEQANKLYNESQLDKAIELYEKLIDMDSNFAKAYNGLGLAYQANGVSPAEVVWYFKTATEIDPQYKEAFENLAKAYYGMGDFPKAEEACKKALEIDPDLVSAQFSLGWIYLLGKSQPAQAIYYFKKVLERAKIPLVHYGLGIAYFMNDQSELTLESITNLRELSQDDLATRLENLIRGHYPVPGEEGPLVDIQPFPVQEKGVLVRSGEKKKVVEEPPSSFGGVTKIRVKGKILPPEKSQLEEKRVLEYGENPPPSAPRRRSAPISTRIGVRGNVSLENPPDTNPQ